MDDDALRVAAVGLGAVWLLGGGLALGGARRLAALCNALVAACLATPSGVAAAAMLFDRAGYAARYGQGALGELPLDAAMVALSLAALGLSVAGLRFGRWLLLPGWLANAPAVLFCIYLAFWFHIFG